MGNLFPVRTFADVDEVASYDGIWACASLLHLPFCEIPDALGRLWSALKPGGVLYLSFKEGQGEREKDGRHFTDLDEKTLRDLLRNLNYVGTLEIWRTSDQRPERSDIWLNALVHRKHPAPDKLITGGKNNPFLPSLLSGIRNATEIDLAVAFIKATGLRLLFADLKEAIDPSEKSRRPPARLRIITSDYLDVTDPEALRSLMLLQERGAQIRIYESAGSSFHMKAYIFVRQAGEKVAQGMAFVGSSNISRQALQDGLEWNYRVEASGSVESSDNSGFTEIRSRFEELFANDRAVRLTYTWIDEYEQRRRLSTIPVAPGSNEREKPPEPTPIQEEALIALDQTRNEGYLRGLVVMATGLGKTWLAAFRQSANECQTGAVRRAPKYSSFQAENTFLRIRPHVPVSFGAMAKSKTKKSIFYVLQCKHWAKLEHLDYFPRHFDYVVVDEFHHAAASTYRRLLGHFEPRFLLGLTGHTR